jgi:hypothetical protein
MTRPISRLARFVRLRESANAPLASRTKSLKASLHILNKEFYTLKRDLPRVASFHARITRPISRRTRLLRLRERASAPLASRRATLCEVWDLHEGMRVRMRDGGGGLGLRVWGLYEGPRFGV